MAEHDIWEERYLSLIPEKLTAYDVRVLLTLIRQDPERFMAALDEFVANSASEDDQGEAREDDASDA